MIQQFNSLIEMMETFSDEQVCIDHLRAIRWKDGAFCPYCNGRRIYTFKDNRTHKCGDCRQRFSIKVGTIFEDSKLPLRKWFMAIWLITSHKKGIASIQLAKDLRITQKSAWFLLHRLRHAARTKSFNRPLEGKVEVDETYMGGKATNKHKKNRTGKRGVAGKTPVVGAVSRKGEVIARVVGSTDAKTLKAFVHDVVSTKVALLSTDDHGGYVGLSATYPHKVVRHSKGEYVAGDAHTQTIDGFWSLLKRQIVGIHHWVSVKHLYRYVDESSWRYNRRQAGEGERVNDFLGQIEARLTYKMLVA